MDLFIPNITALRKTSGTSSSYNNMSGSFRDTGNLVGVEFQKVYFQELVKKCYEEKGNFDSLSDIARIHYEEYYGVGSGAIKRWQINFTNYNIFMNIEESAGIITIKAS